MDRREYVCNQMYKQHDLLRKGTWTDADKLEYMELNIAPYSRYWRMGMKKALKHAIRLLREEEAKADRKTENSSEKPNNCEDEPNLSEIPSGSTISKMEQVDRDINVRSKDEPQKKEVEWVYNKRERLWYPYSNGELLFKTEPTTQTKTQNSNKNSNVISVYDGVSEAVRCAMCSNPNKSDRGCDGACSYDEKLYERLMKAFAESIAEDEPQTDGILFKGNLKEGGYKLIKTTDGWVLEGEDIVYCGWERSSE